MRVHFILALLLSGNVFAASRVIDTRLQMRGSLEHRVTTLQQESSNARFRMHRLARPGSGSRGAVILVHGQMSGFSMYSEVGSRRVEDSLAGSLALEGYSVYGYDPRHALVPKGSCEGGKDCSAMAEWGIQAILDDLTEIRLEVAREFPEKLPVIGGFSFGAMIALAAVNQDPRAYSGLVLLDGTLLTKNPLTRVGYARACRQIQEAIAGGQLYDSATQVMFQDLYSRAKVDPEGQGSLPGLPGHWTNRQAFLLALTMPSLPLVSPFMGLVQAAGET
jgi:pimeloyl-ACP methyl ester carboxylesterase